MNQVSIKRTDSSNQHFQSLVKLLDDELRVYNGADDAFYSQYNKIENLGHVIVAYVEDIPFGCGAVKKYSDNTAEVKRMYVKPDARGKGIGRAILCELEKWAQELGYDSVIMETGKFLTAAVELYKNSGYAVIPNYGQYEGVERSICFLKSFNPERSEGSF